MRRLTGPTRRRFGQGLGAALALALTAPGRRGAADDGPHSHRVRISGFAFEPAALEIRAGDSVIFVNADLAPHTATARDGAWDTGALARAGTARVAFPTPGAHAYLCRFHPRMTGRIVVRPASSDESDAAGKHGAPAAAG